uniref:Arrestin_C domain-containing protein n=1 Tax=Glossina brevipalpis TaxID=37001 RepID=A0A1A9W1M6_9MUSC
MFRNSNIALQTNDLTFLSGDTISGTVILENTRICNFIKIFVALESQNIVDWDDLEAKTKDGFIMHYKQRFENKKTSIHAQRNFLVQNSLAEGNHSYDFTLNIPIAVPSSCTAKFGFIKYQLSLVLHDSKGFQKLDIVPINIRRNFNLSLNPNLLKPFVKECNYNSSWWSFSCLSKPFNATVTLNSCAFVPGDQIEYTVFVENASKYFDVKKIDLILTQNHRFQAKRPYKTYRTDIKVLLTTTHNKPCRRLGKCTMDGYLQLPETLPITSQDPSVIMVNYALHVLIEMKGFNNSTHLRIPIIIGSHNEEIKSRHIVTVADENELSENLETECIV